jgi:hypothetical protein
VASANGEGEFDGLPAENLAEARSPRRRPRPRQAPLR